jgi:hypothetical protein
VHKKGWKKENSESIISFVLVFLLWCTCWFVQVIADDQANLVTIRPSTQVVGAGDDFQVEIYCNPATPIKSFELTVTFDPQMLQASAVTHGTIFNGYQTFFSAGAINNDDGQISAIFDLVMGTGNVSDPGVLVYISFTAQSTTGTTEISLSNCGITNETMYLPVSCSSGSVTIDATPPSCTDTSPSTGYTGDSFTVSARISDNQDASASLTAVLYWNHGSSGGSTALGYIGRSVFQTTIILDDESIDDLIYTIEAVDNHGNTRSTSPKHVSIFDNDDPSVSYFNIDPLVQRSGENMYFSATVADNIGVDEVLLHCQLPNAQTMDLIMHSSGGDQYSIARSFTISGQYACSIIATDLAGNQISSQEISFQITDDTIPEIRNVCCISSTPKDTNPSFGWVNISCDFICDNIAEASVDFIYPDDTTYSFPLNEQDNDQWSVNISFTQTGFYSYRIRIKDTDQLVNTTDFYMYDLPPNYEINNDGIISVIDLLLVSNHMQETGAPGWIREDVNNNGIVSLADINTVALHYGSIW